MGNWFKKDRFGMFIHWGLYSVTAGKWKNMDVPWISEWIMHKYAIPVKEYEQLAAQFDPTDFDADRWVRQIRDAGMKYVVITAKHHDGFAMYHSKCDKYNIVDATPFKRDILAELAAACEKYGIRLGVYYSQDQDWHEAGAAGNFWDFPAEKSREDFRKYLDRKVKPQLRELLTGYGKIAVLWFDTPTMISPEESAELRDFVHELQPECLVSGRIGNDKGDYDSLGDNEIPRGIPFKRPTEGLGTMNCSWGFHALDNAYASADELLRKLGRMCARDANYLLNVGPDAKGNFPPRAVEILRSIGEFLKINGEALYGTKDCGGLLQPFDFQWGEITANENVVYLWIFRSTDIIRLYGLRSMIAQAELLGSGRKIDFSCEHNAEYDYHKLELTPPQDIQGPYVIKLELAGKLDVNSTAYYAGNTGREKFAAKFR